MKDSRTKNLAEKLRLHEEFKAEMARKEAERKAAKQAHRQTVEKEIREDLLAIKTSDKDSCAAAVLGLIKAGAIRHVKIEY